MSKITLSSLSNLQNETTAVGVINANSTVIQTAFDNTLSRDGTSPNTMGSNLDMNSNQILNLPSPASGSSPARLQDVVSNPTLVLTIPPVGTSGATVPLLNTNVTFSGNNTHTGTETFTNTVTLPNQTVTAAEIVNSTITSTQVGTNALSLVNLPQLGVQRILGNGTNSVANVSSINSSGPRQVLATNAAGTTVSFAQPQGDQLLGTTTNDNASAGNVGEFLSGTLSSGSPTTLATATPVTLTQVTLTAGDWDLWGQIIYGGNVATSVTQFQGSLSTTTNVEQNSNNNNYNTKVYNAQTVFNTILNDILNMGPVRVSVAGSTTYFLVAQATFTVNSCTAYGNIQARRVR